MCLICIEYDKNRLTLKEAWTNFAEMYSSMEINHRNEVANRLMDEALYGEEDIDSELWHLMFQGILL